MTNHRAKKRILFPIGPLWYFLMFWIELPAFASAFQKLIEKHSTNSFYIWGDRSILFFLLLQNTLMWRQEWNLANTPHSLRLLVLIVISSSTRDRARSGVNLVPCLLTINCTILLIFLVRQDGHATILFLISRLIFCGNFC